MDKSQGSPVARIIYGIEKPIPQFTWLNYAFALLTIAGADGDVSEEEMDWLMNDFVSIIGGDENFKNALLNFDYINADLEKLLDDISFDIAINYKRALVYDAIKMARADNVYSERERIAVENAVKILNVPMYMAKTIEGLVNTEKSLEETRKSIFEVEHLPIDVYKRRMKEKRMKDTSPMIKKTFGIYKTTDETQLYYGYALMIIAGADGIVSDEEKGWYQYIYAVDEQTPPAILEKVLNFDFRTLTIEECIQKFDTDVSINFGRTLLYNSIKMSRADLHFAEAEKKAAIKAARLLGVDVNIAHTIEYMIDSEEKVAKMRKTLFER